MWLFGEMTKDLATLSQLAKVSICHSPPSSLDVTEPECPVGWNPHPPSRFMYFIFITGPIKPSKFMALCSISLWGLKWFFYRGFYNAFNRIHSNNIKVWVYSLKQLLAQMLKKLTNYTRNFRAQTFREMGRVFFF